MAGFNIHHLYTGVIVLTIYVSRTLLARIEGAGRTWRIQETLSSPFNSVQLAAARGPP